MARPTRRVYLPISQPRRDAEGTDRGLIRCLIIGLIIMGFLATLAVAGFQYLFFPSSSEAPSSLGASGLRSCSVSDMENKVALLREKLRALKEKSGLGSLSQSMLSVKKDPSEMLLFCSQQDSIKWGSTITKASPSSLKSKLPISIAHSPVDQGSSKRLTPYGCPVSYIEPHDGQSCLKRKQKRLVLVMPNNVPWTNDVQKFMSQAGGVPIAWDKQDRESSTHADPVKEWFVNHVPTATREKITVIVDDSNGEATSTTLVVLDSDLGTVGDLSPTSTFATHAEWDLLLTHVSNNNSTGNSSSSTSMIHSSASSCPHWTDRSCVQLRISAEGEGNTEGVPTLVDVMWRRILSMACTSEP